MGGSEDVPVCDEDTATLVLSEEAQPGALLHQHLPRPVPEGGLLSPHNPALTPQWSHPTVLCVVPGYGCGLHSCGTTRGRGGGGGGGGGGSGGGGSGGSGTSCCCCGGGGG